MRHPLPLLFVGWLALCATPSHAAPQVPVTETWGDLLQRAPLRAGPTWVRLGLEARQAKPGSPVLVYALFEGATGPGERGRSGFQLGPLEVVPVPEVRARRKELEQAKRLQRFPSDALNVLYAATLRVPEQGLARYEVRAGQEVVARFSLRASGQPDQPWFVVRRPETATQALKSSRDTTPEALRVSSARASARWPGHEALRWETPQDLIHLLEDLPRATPTTTKLGVRRDATGVLELSLAAGLGEPAGHLLARVWVRGRPVNLRQKQPQVQERRGLERKRERRVRVRLALDLRGLGAEEGDRVEVQLLYSPQGVEYEAERCEALRALAQGAPALSQRFLLREGRVDAELLEGVLQRLPAWKGTGKHPCVRLLAE